MNRRDRIKDWNALRKLKKSPHRHHTALIVATLMDKGYRFSKAVSLATAGFDSAYHAATRASIDTTVRPRRPRIRREPEDSPAARLSQERLEEVFSKQYNGWRMAYAERVVKGGPTARIRWSNDPAIDRFERCLAGEHNYVCRARVGEHCEVCGCRP